MGIKAIYPDCAASNNVTPSLVMRKKRPHRKMDGPFHPREHIPLPEASTHECDGKMLMLIGGTLRASNYWSLGAVLLFSFCLVGFVSIFYPLYDDGIGTIHRIDWFWWPIVAFCLIAGLYYLRKSYNTPFVDYTLFNREAGTVMFPPQKGRQLLVLPFDMVECVGTMHYHSRGGQHYLSYLVAKKKPRGEKDRSIPLWFTDARGRSGAEKEWKLICTFMDKTQPIPAAFDGWIAEFKRTGLNVCRQIVDQTAYDKALAQEQAEAKDEIYIC